MKDETAKQAKNNRDLKTSNFKTNSFLRLISGEPIILGPTCGSKVIADAAGLFTAGIDKNFRDWKTDKPCAVTGETPILVYEMVRDATPRQMFDSLSPDLDSLCLTQHQIIDYVEIHRGRLSDEHAAFFLFKSHGVFFDAFVGIDWNGMFSVSVSRLFFFPLTYFVSVENRHRLVAPQLA